MTAVIINFSRLSLVTPPSLAVIGIGNARMPCENYMAAVIPTLLLLHLTMPTIHRLCHADILIIDYHDLSSDDALRTSEYIRR